jgi:hypothetical protein
MDIQEVSEYGPSAIKRLFLFVVAFVLAILSSGALALAISMIFRLLILNDPA